MFALLLLAQVAAWEAVATCHTPADPDARVYALERGPRESWRVAYSAKSLDRPRVELPLANARPRISGQSIGLSLASANGGLAINWSIEGGPKSISWLELRVNHSLEVNVERDLDPAVDSMNTDGPINLECEVTAGSREPRVNSPQSEWNVAVGLARSVRLFESTAGRAYAVQTIGWSRELTGELKFFGIRGRFAWGVEATPLFAQFSPTTIHGVGIAPVVWRWNFPPPPKWSAFAELSMGGLWTSDEIPEKTSRLNFTAHWGGGIRRKWRDRDALLLAYRFQHFSNGNQLGSNPGVNSHVLLAGWSHRGSR